jgi:predicted protein tyrosine phosphatase
MIESSRNQCGNAKNPYQGKTKKVLCVCSAGLLRSPTTAKFLQSTYGYNVRACGVAEEYALVPISTALIYWSDEIVFAEQEHYEAVKDYLQHYTGRIVVLGIPDMYEYDNPKIHEYLQANYKVEE